MVPTTAAVIAAGSQGRVHALGYRSVPGVKLVAVADPTREAAAALAAELEIPRSYDDAVTLL